ncbi:hypothetical protein ANCDUO_17072 [Ancylostoma duodenale]|uniref:Uncharacterized protein n=1 Tax=Ancylostoma duodenale TaxID=51022 RepID=A0A0C2C954_9BILA|nr:hypothetical protein ANCDUO_17072 [Ancylostoma duodenale]
MLLSLNNLNFKTEPRGHNIYQNEAAQPHRSNLTSTEQRGFKKLLRLRSRLRYTVGDKCGSFVVMPQSLDKNITGYTLSDSSTYAETTAAAFRKACEKVRKTISTVVKPKLGANVAKGLLESWSKNAANYTA